MNKRIRRDDLFDFKWLMNVLMVAAIYGIVARLSLLLDYQHTNASPIWPPSGIAFAAILYFGYRLWPGVAIGAFAANLLVFTLNSPMAVVPTIVASLIIGIGNSLEALAGVYLLTRLGGGRNPLYKTYDVLRFVTIALVMCVISPLIGVSTLAFLGVVSWSVYPVAWFTWWLGDVTGVLMIAPLLLLWFKSPHQKSLPEKFKPTHWMEIVLFTGLLIAVTLLIFGGYFDLSTLNYPIAHILFPIIIFAAFRFRQQGVGWSVLFICAMAMWGTLHGFGSFARADLNQSLLFMQAFIGVISITGLLMAAALQERDEARTAVLEKERWLRTLIENSTDIISLLGPDGTIVYSSPSTTKVMGYPLNEYIGRNVFEFIHPEDLGLIQQKFSEVTLKAGNMVFAQCRFLHKNGFWLWLEGSGSNLLNDPNIQAIIVNCRDISHRKQTEDALRASEEHFHGIYDSSKDAIGYIGLDGVLLDVNNAFVELTGYSREELLEVDKYEDLTPPEYHKLEIERTREVLFSGRSVEYEKEYVKKDGSRLPVLVTLFMVKGVGLAVIVKDISDRKRFEEERFRLAAIVDSSHDAIIGKTLDGIITSWNNAAERLYGYKANEVVGKSIFILIPPDRPNELDDILLRLKSGERLQQFETIRMHKNGKFIEVSLTISPIKNAVGKVIGASTISRDITQRKRMERQIIEAAKLKSEFTSTVSHELRTPLAISKEALSLLVRGRVGEMSTKQKEILTIAGSNIDRLCYLIDDILDFSKIEAGKMQIHKEPVNLIPLIQENCEGWRLKANLKKINLEIKLPSMPLVIPVDKSRFLQILSNLLNNALKFTHEGGKVEVVIEEKGNSVQVSVVDNGQGIDRDDLPKLFQKFQQLGRTHGPGAQGTGLGLNITKALVELHQGQIFVCSEFGKGSTFSFTLPKDAKVTEKQENFLDS